MFVLIDRGFYFHSKTQASSLTHWQGWANYNSTLEEMVFVLTLFLIFMFGFSSSSLALLLKGVLQPQYSRVEGIVFTMMLSVVCMCLYVFLFVFFSVVVGVTCIMFLHLIVWGRGG